MTKTKVTFLLTGLIGGLVCVAPGPLLTIFTLAGSLLTIFSLTWGVGVLMPLGNALFSGAVGAHIWQPFESGRQITGAAAHAAITDRGMI